MSIDVAIMMGSKSDLEVMRPAAKVLTALGLKIEVRVLSAHRTPAETAGFVRDAAAGGCKVFICAAGGAAHLAGAVAAHTTRPVIGVPIAGGLMGGLDSLLSTVMMPPGMPVATVAVGGAENAGLLAAQIISIGDPALASKVEAERQSRRDKVLASDAEVKAEFPAADGGAPVAHAFPEEIAFAVEALRRGEVVAYPTETFYGLGVNALDELALARLRALKGRGAEKAISILVSDAEMLGLVCKTLSPLARRLIAKYWPGALTLVLPARAGLPAPLVQDGFIAVRVSSHPTAQALVKAFGAPLTTTSANHAGDPPASTPEAVEEAFEGRCRVLHAGATPGGAASTVVRVKGGTLEILRQGAIQPEAD